MTDEEKAHAYDAMEALYKSADARAEIHLQLLEAEKVGRQKAEEKASRLDSLFKEVEQAKPTPDDVVRACWPRGTNGLHLETASRLRVLGEMSAAVERIYIRHALQMRLMRTKFEAARAEVVQIYDHYTAAEIARSDRRSQLGHYRTALEIIEAALAAAPADATEKKP